MKVISKITISSIITEGKTYDVHKTIKTKFKRVGLTGRLVEEPFDQLRYYITIDNGNQSDFPETYFITLDELRNQKIKELLA
jgi:hypothetical protein